MNVYLDYNAGAPMRTEVWRAMTSAGADARLANASSSHFAGRAARAVLEEARGAVAALVGATAPEIVFTSGGTEANNFALRGARQGCTGGHIVTTAIEHASVLETCARLDADGVAITRVHVDRTGRVNPADVAAACRPDTVLISVGLANNEVGTVQSLRAIADIARRRGIPIHTDAVQAVGKIAVHVEALGVDLLSLSAHKLGGPQGIGALYIRNGIAITPLLLGGPQERDRRGGTENVIGALGFGVAAALAECGAQDEWDRQARLVDRLWRCIVRTIADVERNGATDGVVPNTLNLTFRGADADTLLIGLDLCGIAVSAGSACAAGSLEPSHVLLAMGRSAEEARAALRISLGQGTTDADVDALATALPSVVARSRGTDVRETGT
jgi:cysteine desulfurase